MSEDVHTEVEGPPGVPQPFDQGGVVLFVDDEKNILSALRRLFHGSGHRVLLAESAEEGLEFLENESVDVVVSDMRMPGMDGAAFLEEVRRRWPDVLRMLLTGFADMASTIQAINRGEVYRYITKPWDDNDLRLIVRNAIAVRRLEKENLRLHEVTQRQNRLLRDLNASLEKRVAQRTEELRDAMSQLQQTHATLKKSFLNTVHVLSGLIEMRESRLGGHSRRVAETAHTLARELGMDDSAAQDVMLAGLLHDLGKIGLSDDILRKPELELSDPERAIMRKHPVTAELVLMAVESLQEAAKVIRHHHERYDGQGYPDGLKGDAIPLGARILALVNDYDSLQTGEHFPRKLSIADARQYLRDGAGSRYDPRVINAFMRLWAGESKGQAPAQEKVRSRGARVARPLGAESPARRGTVASAIDVPAHGDAELAPLRPRSLCPGMVLVDDVMHPDGYLLLSRGFVFDDRVIARLIRLEGSLGVPMWLLVTSNSEAGG